MKTQDLLIPALAFMAGAFYAKRNNKVSGIGAAEIIDFYLQYVEENR